MSNNTYCFNILNSSNNNLSNEDINSVKKYIKKLYKNGDNPIDKLPGVIFQKKTDNKVCIYMRSKGKKNVDAIEIKNKDIKNKYLSEKRRGKNPNNIFKVNDHISLEPPEILNIENDKWWDDDNIEAINVSKNAKKWSSLIHNGPCFPHIMKPYSPIGNLYLKLGQVKLPLNNPNDEKLSLYYAKRKIQDETATYSFTQNLTFNKNFYNDYMKLISRELRSQINTFDNFMKLDWSDLMNYIIESKVELSSEEKDEKLILTLENKDMYGYALVDGKPIKIGNFLVEQGGIFLGHPDQKTGRVPPNSGKIKREIYPEDVIVNCGRNDPVPIPPQGHSWLGVEHHTDKIWLSKYLDTVTGKLKYILFGNEGKFKGQNEMKKFIVARKLNMNIDNIRREYEDDARTGTEEKKQLATVL